MPGAAVGDIVMVKVLETEPPEGGVIGLGTKPHVTPVGSPEQERLVALVNPFKEVIVQVLVVLLPGTRLTEDGLHPMLKSAAGGGGGGGPAPSGMNTPKE